MSTALLCKNPTRSWAPTSSAKWCARCARWTPTASTTAKARKNPRSLHVLTRARRQEIPLVGDPDEETLARVKALYNAIAVLIEKECRLLAVPLIHLTHEGFGRAR